MKEKTEVQGKFNEKSLHIQISYYLLILSAHYLKTLGFWNCFSIIKSEYLGQRDWRLEGFRNRMSHCRSLFQLLNYLCNFIHNFHLTVIKGCFFPFPFSFFFFHFLLLFFFFSSLSFSSSFFSWSPGNKTIHLKIESKFWRKQVLVCNWEWVVF